MAHAFTFRVAGTVIILLAMLLATPTHAVAPTGYTAGAPGDADCSAAVTAADALAVLDELAGFAPHNPACGADTDSDGVDVGDALTIRRWVAGLPVRPNLEDVVPGSVPVGSPDTIFMLTGGFISPGTVIQWNGTPYLVRLLDGGSRATVLIPASEFAAESGFPLVLTMPGQPSSASIEFDVTAPGTCSEPVATAGTLVVDKDGTPGTGETAVFTLNAPQDMTGWTLYSTLGEQSYQFPDGYFYYPAFGAVTIVSGIDMFPDSQTNLWWQKGTVWNNDFHDSGEIRNCLDQVVVEWIDPETDTN